MKDAFLKFINLRHLAYIIGHMLHIVHYSCQNPNPTSTHPNLILFKLGLYHHQEPNVGNIVQLDLS